MLRVVIMGVSGSGKSAVGRALSHLMNVPYCEGDDLHPAVNIEKMTQGIPLTDDDRWPWLDNVAETLSCRAPVIVSCSALKKSYRSRIRAGAGGPVQFIHLSGSRQTIGERLFHRKNHFMPVSLLESQFALLEPPDRSEALTVDIALPVTTMADAIAAELRRAMLTEGLEF